MIQQKYSNFPKQKSRKIILRSGGALRSDHWNNFTTANLSKSKICRRHWAHKCFI